MNADLESEAAELDQLDQLSGLRERFVDTNDDLVYLDGNSLGRPARAARDALMRTFDTWNNDLILGWRDWIRLPAELGDRMAQTLLGASHGEVILGDSTTVCLYKTIAGAVRMLGGSPRLITTDDNFPTDLYVLESIAREYSLPMDILPAGSTDGLSRRVLLESLVGSPSIVCLSHVAYRSGALIDLAATNEIIHDHSSIGVWDLSHSAGVLPIDLHHSHTKLAVGCTYKYLNAGPGAPAYTYVHSSLHDRFRQPIWGWFGHKSQFDMGAHYLPADDVRQSLAGAPSILSLIGLDASLDAINVATIDRIRKKSMLLTDYIVNAYESLLKPLGFSLASPRRASGRGGHISLRHPHAKSLVRSLIRQRVITDFRPPDLIRIAPSPLYTQFGDVWEALRRLAAVASSF